MDLITVVIPTSAALLARADAIAQNYVQDTTRATEITAKSVSQ